MLVVLSGVSGAGKLVIKTEIAIPKKLNDKEKELFLKLKKVSEFNPNNIVDIK